MGALGVARTWTGLAVLPSPPVQRRSLAPLRSDTSTVAACDPVALAGPTAEIPSAGAGRLHCDPGTSCQDSSAWNLTLNLLRMPERTHTAELTLHDV